MGHGTFKHRSVELSVTKYVKTKFMYNMISQIFRILCLFLERVFSIYSRLVQKDNDSIGPSFTGRYWGRIIRHLKIMEAGPLITLMLLAPNTHVFHLGLSK